MLTALRLKYINRRKPTKSLQSKYGIWLEPEDVKFYACNWFIALARGKAVSFKEFRRSNLTARCLVVEQLPVVACFLFYSK